MGSATLLSRILGLVREQAFAYFFGAGNAMDAFNVAFRLPNVLRNIFAEGAMSAALIPVFTRVRVEEGDERAWRLAGLIFRVLGAAASLMAVAGIIAAPILVDFLAGSFHRVPGKLELTVALTRALFPYFPLIALSAALMAVLNCCGRFFLPALSSAVFNGVAIVTGVCGVLALESFHQRGWLMAVHPIEGMALGMIAGGVAQVLFQLPLLYRQGYRWVSRSRRDAGHVPVAWHQDRGLRAVLSMILPGTLGLAATQLSVVVNTILATTQAVGAVSWLSYAFRLMQFPIGIFGASLASATLARISRDWAEHNFDAVKQSLADGLRHSFAINLPASAGLAFLAYPVIELVFQYGSFQSRDTHATAVALAMYALGLPAYSMVKILAPACYVLGAVRLPMFCSFASVILTVALNLLLIRPLGYWSLALGTSVGAVFNALCLLHFLNQRLVSRGGGLDLPGIWRSFLRNLTVSVVMGIGVLVTCRWIQAEFPVFHAWVPLTRLFKVALLSAEGVLLAGMLSRVFGCDETAQILNLFAKSFKKKLRRDLF